MLYLSVHLSVCVCVSVTLRYCIKTAKRRITQTTPHDSPMTLVLFVIHPHVMPSIYTEVVVLTLQNARLQIVFVVSILDCYYTVLTK